MKKCILLAAAVVGMLVLCTACSRRTAVGRETGRVEVDEDGNTEVYTQFSDDLNNDHIEDPTEITTRDKRDMGDKVEDAAERAGEAADEAMEDMSEAFDGEKNNTKREA